MKKWLSGPFILLGAVSASGSLALAGMAENRELLGAGEDAAEASLPEARRRSGFERRG